MPATVNHITRFVLNFTLDLLQQRQPGDQFMQDIATS